MSPISGRRPVVGLAACIKTIPDEDGLTFHTVPDPYVTAVAAVGALPLIVPALGDEIDVGALFDALDGIVLTGGISNLRPDRYGCDCRPCPPYDDRRDGTALALVKEAMARDVPFLGICRGIQEMNVALGGTLHPRVHEVGGRFDHRSDYNAPVDEQFAPVHEISLVSGGFLNGIAGTDRLMVNSLHGQGIDRMADGLVIEALAPDGQIEAVRLPGKRFAVGVQWHPEWNMTENAFSTALFQAFADALSRPVGRV